MRKIVHWVNAPFISGVMMLRVSNAVKDWVAQPDVGRGHVNLRAQGARAVWELAGLHALKEVEALLDRSISKRAVLAGPVGGAAVFVGVFCREVIDVRDALLDEPQGVFVDLIEIIG